jgi:hypothetical protein
MPSGSGARRSRIHQPKRQISSPLDSVSAQLKPSKFGSHNGIPEVSSGQRSLEVVDNKSISGENNHKQYLKAATNSKGELMPSPNQKSPHESGIERDLSLIHNAIFSAGIAHNMMWDPHKQEFVRKKTILESDSGLNTPKMLSSLNTGKVSPRVAAYTHFRTNQAKDSSKLPDILVLGQSESRIQSQENSELPQSNSQTPKMFLRRSNSGLDFHPDPQYRSKLMELEQENERSGTAELSKPVSSSGVLGDNSSGWNFQDTSRGQNLGYQGHSSHLTSRMGSKFIEDDDEDGY